tara:strand:+ start:462 stop:1124 length:663 start_codon:yes stop_codon:yes gene_type:complete
MQGIGSTNISELPVTNNIGIVNQPIQPQMQPQQQQMQSQQQQQMQSQQMRSNVELNIEPKPQGVTMDTSTTQSAYNELVGQIQQADKLGVTQLPSRDIPNNTDRVVMDQEIQPDYIPEQAAMEDYINNYQTPNDVILAGEREEQSRDRLDILYSNIQMPLLVAILYFLFNLPVIRKYLQKWIPNIFNSDGNPNLVGYIVNSVLFGGLYYLLNNAITNMVA